MSGERGRPTRVLLSINFNHDGSGVLLVDGRIAGYVTTERRSRLKKHPGLRDDDLDELLAQAGLRIDDVDHVLLCNLHTMDSPDIPTLHGGDLKETWLRFWVNQDNSLVDLRGRHIPCTVNPDHHLIHAACAYFTSPYESAVAVAIDPTGCRSFVGRDNRLVPLLHNFDAWFNANVAYTEAGRLLFGSGILGAGKVMGLAPFGRPVAPVAAAVLDGLRSFHELEELAGAGACTVTAGGRRLNATLAYYVQVGLERQLTRLFRELHAASVRAKVAPVLCLAGGTALNAVGTELAFAASAFEGRHLHPACGDDGTSIGAALWYWHHVLGNPRQGFSAAELMYGVRQYTPQLVRRALDRHAADVVVERVDDHAGRAAELIATGAVVGWFDGAGEIGPRALGHRSILADPRDPDMPRRINAEVKFREDFRPFAPAVLVERAGEWFGVTDSPFMLRAVPVRRPDVPAVTHVDGTARLQTVAPGDNPSFHTLIAAFADRTGVPMVLNTSLNTRGEPLVETPEDALRTLLGCGLDHLVMPHLVISKRRPR